MIRAKIVLYAADGIDNNDIAERLADQTSLAAFNHLGATYTPNGIILDRLTPTQRTIPALLDIPLLGFPSYRGDIA